MIYALKVIVETLVHHAIYRGGCTQNMLIRSQKEGAHTEIHYFIKKN